MRTRDLGIRIGRGTPGPLNAITDVGGVTVGHTTLIHGDGPLVVGQGPVRTGVTIARAGGTGGHTSGDLFIAFATGNRLPVSKDDDHDPAGFGTYEVHAVGDLAIDRIFDAAIESTEEAIINALVAATTVVGRDGITAHALPHDRLVEIMAAHGRGAPGTRQA